MTPEQQLRANLIAVHALEESEPFSKDLARKAIVSSELDMIVCRGPTGWLVSERGCCTFKRLYQVVWRETLEGRPLKQRVTETERKAKGI